jgi:N-methylhydantoinase B
VEVAERNSQMFCHHKRFVPGSGGAGRRRGGLGQEILFESESERPIVALFMTERTRVAAPGFSGGDDGQIGRVEINGVAINNRVQHVLHMGDTVLLRTPGGGGYGDPKDRPDDLIERDRMRGYSPVNANGGSSA